MTINPGISASEIKLQGFLSEHNSPEMIVQIRSEPRPIYLEEGRTATHLNFDFVLTGLTDRVLDLVFLKVAVYDTRDALLTYRYLNRNAVGSPGIETIGRIRIEGRESVDLFNPFHSFASDLSIHRLRYMFTFRDRETGDEFYYGNIEIRPETYQQRVVLDLPVKGLVTVLDGHDYYSHHRRFAITIARSVTRGALQENFARYALDFVHIGDDGNTRRRVAQDPGSNYDFHFPDARHFYSDRAPVYAPADGVVVRIVDGLADLYEERFNFKAAVQSNRVAEMAGNYVVIKHNDGEYSHLFHLLLESIEVEMGQHVARGQFIGLIGFSGAATVYSHLHYHLQDGPDFLQASALPFKFRSVVLLNNGNWDRDADVAIDTGDILWNE